MKKTKLLAIVLTLVLLVAALTGCAQQDLEAANKKIAALEAEKTTLEKDKATLTTEKTDLQKQLEEAKIFKAENFPKWFEEDSGLWRTVVNGSFKTDAASQPSKEDVEKILHYASLAPTSGGKTDYYMIAITDEAEQQAIIGSTYGVATSAGTVTILVLADRLYDETVRADGGAVKCQPDRGYYDVGIVSGYLNVATIALGYGSHYFMSPALPKDNGQFDSSAVGFDVSAYTKDLVYVNGNNGDEVKVAGNCKFVCAIVIGQLNEDAETKVTSHEYPENYTIWTKPTEK